MSGETDWFPRYNIAPNPLYTASHRSVGYNNQMSFQVNGQPREAVLPVTLQPRIVQNTQWVVLTGSKTFQL